MSIAQETQEEPVEYHPSIWLEAGVGTVGLQFGYDLSFNFNINEKNYLSFSKDRAIEVSNETRSDFDEAKSWSVRYGGLKKYRLGVIQYAAGAAWVTGTHITYDMYSYEERKDFSTIGFTAKVGAIFTPNVIGIGGGFFIHINKEFTYHGLTINLALGSLNGRVKKD